MIPILQYIYFTTGFHTRRLSRFFYYSKYTIYTETPLGPLNPTNAPERLYAARGRKSLAPHRTPPAAWGKNPHRRTTYERILFAIYKLQAARAHGPAYSPDRLTIRDIQANPSISGARDY